MTGAGCRSMRRAVDSPAIPEGRCSRRDVPCRVPWATDSKSSFLATSDEMNDSLRAAGFVVECASDRTAFALDFFKQLRSRANSGPPVLGIHLLMGESYGEKVANMVENISSGRCGPWELVCRRA